ncbi:hypothetical protein UA08_00266 [Talaromyces atroroseus]|uniref:Subtelomeric hrmA-associated cluster protein AFUB-079030/YDR124W-like helical bundle domain-containing protein n=1 Tax=Talaromyces atroroseus TaxID=1441469 RepID=A0A225ARM6_TALAT|nr:hypothetical protein UA08_00266 [Talaromyces atroroseus]OKL63640.1 hypothetical protein UA08_00266 [Talaromyces atroroseus]
MVVRASPSSGHVKAGARLPSEDYSPFETPEPDVIFTGPIPQYWAMVYLDRSGNVREASNLRTTVFSAQAKEEFLAAKNNFVLQNQQNSLLSPHTAYSPRPSSSPRGHSRRAGQPKRRRTAFRAEPLAVSYIDSDNEEDAMITLKIGDRQKVTAYYESAFRRLQQLNCRMLAKNFIKLIEPRKQVKHPYNGGKPRAGAPPGEKGDPEKTKPDWWPRDVIHREPDHLKKDYITVRLKLLVHIVQCLLPMGITADKLQETANDVRRHIKPPERATILDEVFRVRRLEERYERDEVDETARISVTDHEGAKRREPESDDEQVSGVLTPPESSDEPLPDDPQSPSEMAAGMPQHGLQLDNTAPGYQMAPDLSFTSQGQPTPDFRSSQPEMIRRSLSTTHITGAILTPTHNQFMDHSQFTTSTPAEQMQAISQTSAHAQAEASISFADWSPAFQQNMFSPVDFHGASRQVTSQIAYPAYTTYPSPHAQEMSPTYTAGPYTT